MPNRAIEIHDSVLAGVSLVDGRAELSFAALYVHESEGEPGVDAGIGWFQKAILRIDSASVKGGFSEYPVDLTHGTVQIGEQVFDNGFPFPLKYTGSFEVRLRAMWRDESISIAGTGAQLELVGERGAIEEFPR